MAKSGIIFDVFFDRDGNVESFSAPGNVIEVIKKSKKKTVLTSNLVKLTELEKDSIDPILDTSRFASAEKLNLETKNQNINYMIFGQGAVERSTPSLPDLIQGTSVTSLLGQTTTIYPAVSEPKRIIFDLFDKNGFGSQPGTGAFGPLVASGADNKNKEKVKKVSKGENFQTIAKREAERIMAAKKTGFEKYKRIIENNKPGKKTNIKISTKKIAPYFVALDLPAKLFLIKEDDPTNIYDASASFILSTASEGDSIRNEIVSTHGADILNLFGKNVKIWQYSGNTFGGGKNKDIVVEEKKDKNANFWYDDLDNFFSSYLGQPEIDGSKYKIRMEYQNFIREGYILDYNFNKNSSNSKVISFGFRMAIKDFYTTEVEKSGKKK